MTMLLISALELDNARSDKRKARKRICCFLFTKVFRTWFCHFFLVGGTHISLAHGELHSNDYVYILFNFVYIEHSFQC